MICTCVAKAAVFWLYVTQPSFPSLPTPSLRDVKQQLGSGLLCVGVLISAPLSPSFQLGTHYFSWHREAGLARRSPLPFSMYPSMYLSIYLSVNIFFVSSFLSVSLSGLWSINLALCPFSRLFCSFLSLIKNTYAAGRFWAIRVACCAVLGVDFDAEIRRTRQHINVPDQAT